MGRGTGDTGEEYCSGGWLRVLASRASWEDLRLGDWTADWVESGTGSGVWNRSGEDAGVEGAVGVIESKAGLMAATGLDAGLEDRSDMLKSFWGRFEMVICNRVRNI